jgi:hypothetical protein
VGRGEGGREGKGRRLNECVFGKAQYLGFRGIENRRTGEGLEGYSECGMVKAEGSGSV